MAREGRPLPCLDAPNLFGFEVSARVRGDRVEADRRKIAEKWVHYAVDLSGAGNSRRVETLQPVALHGRHELIAIAAHVVRREVVREVHDLRAGPAHGIQNGLLLGSRQFEESVDQFAGDLIPR